MNIFITRKTFQNHSRALKVLKATDSWNISHVFNIACENVNNSIFNNYWI